MTPRILIVDDSLTVRMDLAEAFETGGLHPVPCGTTGDARRVLDTDHVDVIILDVHLPDGDGVDLLRELRADPRYGATPVLMLSSEAEVKDRVRGLRTGADEYVGKPYDAVYVVARARELLGARAGDDTTTVLLIDDSRTLRAELSRALRGDGYAVVTAETGEEGLRIAAIRRPGMIIVDGVLPGIDGATVIRRVRLDPALRDIPCVLLTGSTDRGLELDVLDAGADAFVRKDEPVSLLLAKVAAILRQSGGADHAGRSSNQPSSLHGPKKILAVDADPAYLATLADHLRGDGYDVVGAQTAGEAVELLAAQPVDCILLDPEVSGLTCHFVKAAPVVRDIPLIVLGSGDGTAAVLAGLADGADDYVVKSDAFDILRARVRAQIRRKHLQDENRRSQADRLQQELESAQARAALELARTRAALINELEWKNSELEAFSYSVSHDLRNPLHIIEGFSQLLLDDVDSLDETTAGYVRSISAAAGRMSDLIRSLLRLSRAGRTDLDRTDVDLTAIAHRVVDALLTREPDRPVRVSVAAGLTAHADADLMHVVLDNLIGNAWKYTRRTELPYIEVGVSDGAFFVRDNGAGFPMDRADDLFRPYGRLHDADEFPGTGIGLATVSRVIERHGGRIWAESEVGAGATFSFTIG